MPRIMAKCLLSLVFVASLALATWEAARAWSYDGKWLSNSVRYRFHYTVPSSMFAPTHAGANAWTNVTPSSWAWIYDTTNGYFVKYGYVDGLGPALAVTGKIITGGNITWMEITIDNAELWHTGSGIPPSNRYDLQSTMTHEFGHALGLLHTGYPYCPNNTSDATMCPTQGLGAYHYRTLEGDDRNGVNSLYP